jgi:hypothetical protein
MSNSFKNSDEDEDEDDDDDTVGTWESLPGMHKYCIVPEIFLICSDPVVMFAVCFSEEALVARINNVANRLHLHPVYIGTGRKRHKIIWQTCSMCV